MSEYQILYWLDIPTAVKAWDGFDEEKVELAPRFMERVDMLAGEKGLTAGSDYMAQFKWGEIKERDGEPDEVVNAVKEELESEYP